MSHNQVSDSRIRMFTMRNVLNEKDEEFKRKSSAYIIPNKIHPVVWKQKDIFDSENINNLRLSKFLDACKLKNIELAIQIVKSASITRPRSQSKSFIPNESLVKKRDSKPSLLGHMRSSSSIKETKKPPTWRTAEVAEDANFVQLRDFLLIACRYNLVDVAMKVIECGADPIGDPFGKYSPLYICCLFGANDVFCSCLSSYNIHVNITDINGCTPLHLMILSGTIDSVKRLIELGSDIFAVDSFRKLPLYYSYLTRNREIINYLWEVMSNNPENIKTIDLSKCGMNFFPNDSIISRFQQLEVLDLSNNSLHYVSPAIGKLMSLRELYLSGNPLRALPSNFQFKDLVKQKHYLNMLNHRGESYCRRRIVVLGCQNVGKSSLIRSLKLAPTLTSSPSVSGLRTFRTLRQSVFKQEMKSSDKLLELEEDEKGLITISEPIVLSRESSKVTRAIFWELPSTTEEFIHYFLKGDVIFLVVYNLEELDLKDIDFWLESIKLIRDPDSCSPIFLVGTHSDNPLCSNDHISAVTETLQQRYPLSFYRGLHEDNFITLNCNDNNTVTPLRQRIVQLISNPKFSDNIFPKLTSISWLIFKQLLSTIEEPYMLKEDLLHALHACNIPQNELLSCILFLQSCDNILSFDLSTKDKHLVILNMDWWERILKRILSPKNIYLKQGGILTILDLQKYFLDLSELFLEELVFVMEQDLLLFKLHNQIIIPSLLYDVKPPEISEVWPTLAPIGKYECQRIYRYSQNARNLFIKLQKEILHTPNITDFKLWKEGLYITTNEQHILITITVIKRSYQILISVRYPQEGVGSNAGMMLVICEILEGLIRSGYPQLLTNTQRLIPCVHCLMLRVLTGKTFLFKYDECYRAVTQGKPFIFCNNIASPSRCVRVDKLAPDIAFADINQIKETEFSTDYLLGKGGFGSVYHGILNKTKEIAVKELTLRSDCSEDEKVASFGEFLREAYIMSFLHHPNLVAFEGVCLTGLPRLLMEYVPCGDLSNLIISRKKPLEEWFIRKIALDIAIGMNHLHSISPPIIHRDLRSPNIFLVSLDKNAPIIAKIADFGLSRMKVSQLEETLSTYQWMAPETLGTSGKKVEYDEKIDVYSYGVILWELLALDFPFDEYITEPKYTYSNPAGETVFNTNAVKEAIEFNNLRPTLPKTTPLDIKNLIIKCWNKKASKRPSFYEIILKLDPAYNFSQTMLTDTDSSSLKVVNEDSESETLVTVVNSIKCIKSVVLHTDDSYAPCMSLVVNNRLWVSCHNGSVLIYNIENEEEEEITITDDKLNKNNTNDEEEEGDNNNNKELEDDTKIVKTKNNKKSSIFTWQSHKGAIYCLNEVETKRGKEIWIGGTDGMISVYPHDAMEHRSLKRKWSLSREKTARIRASAIIVSNRKKTMWVGDISTKITVIDVNTYETVAFVNIEKKASVFAIIQHSDGKVWIGSSGGIYIYDPDAFQLLQWFSAHSNSQVLSLISVGQNVWTGSSDGKISVWTSSFEKVTTLTAHTSKIFCFCLDYRGYVWSGSFDTTIIVWDPNTYKPVEELAKHKDSIRALTCYKNSSIWSCSIDNTLKNWEYSN